ncbi:MAG: methyl-accepting chemotaxis protein [Pyrinomonadaceae bacterium]
MRWYQRLSTKLAVTVVIAVGIALIVSGLLVTALDPQLAAVINASIVKIIGGGLFMMALLAGLIIFLTQRFMRPLDEVVKVANGIAQGKLEGVIAVRSNDEVGQMSYAMNKVVNYLQEMSSVADQISEGNLQVEITPRSSEDRFGIAFQNMLERTLRLVQTQDERNRLQRSIMKLLEEVADVGDGDLTAEAEVTADATGAIADAFNYMIVELRGIIGRVKVTSAQVDSSAAQVQTTTENMVRRSEQQSTQLNTLSSALEEMATAMQEVAQETTASARVSDSALANAKQGTNVVSNNIASMNRLRSRVQETSERIKRLGERSQEISSIVKIINDLAQRTSVLALNASIQATAAGQAGRGFVAVAEEVERLAERSATASKQIDALTKAIQGETEEAVTSMETTVKEVAVGVKLTGEVGETLNVIESVTQQLAEISQSVAAAARRQAETSADISDTMRAVATNSQQNASGMKESAASVNQLAIWAQDLRGSVASFKLPEADEPANTVSVPNSNGVGAGVSV